VDGRFEALASLSIEFDERYFVSEKDISSALGMES
jgi:hypothetical protein